MLLFTVTKDNVSYQIMLNSTQTAATQITEDTLLNWNFMSNFAVLAGLTQMAHWRKSKTRTCMSSKEKVFLVSLSSEKLRQQVTVLMSEVPLESISQVDLVLRAETIVVLTGLIKVRGDLHNNKINCSRIISSIFYTDIISYWLHLNIF